MILNEIEMTISYVKDEYMIREIQNKEGLNYNEAKEKYLIHWKSERRKFQLMTRCMTSMVVRMMPKIKTKDCWKIIIEWVDKIAPPFFKINDGLYTVKIEGNIEEFYQLDSYMKKKVVIDKVIEAINILSELTDIDMEGIKETCLEIRRLNYINEWMWGKPKKYERGFAQIKVQHEVNKVVLSMVFFDKDMNIIKQVPLILTKPHEWEYSRYLGNVRWLSDKEAVLITKTGELFPARI